MNANTKFLIALYRNFYIKNQSRS